MMIICEYLNIESKTMDVVLKLKHNKTMFLTSKENSPYFLLNIFVKCKIAHLDQQMCKRVHAI